MNEKTVILCEKQLFFTHDCEKQLLVYNKHERW